MIYGSNNQRNTMKPWETLARARLEDGTELTLRRHPSEIVIEADGRSLMSSRQHASEEALARLGCADALNLPRPRILIGGLGMGFTLRAALDILPPDAVVVVAELVLAVIEWNRGPLADLARRPLEDPRVQLEPGNVATLIRTSRSTRFDAILLDVDNGPIAMTSTLNERLYDRPGLLAAHAALRPGGLFAVWSATNEPDFERRLRAAGFDVRRESASARLDAVRDHVGGGPSRDHEQRPARGRGPRHTIVIGRRQE
jgi:spermidine synthase